MFCDRVIVCFEAQSHLKFILKNYSIWNSQDIVGKYQASMEDFRFLLVFIISCMQCVFLPFVVHSHLYIEGKVC